MADIFDAGSDSETERTERNRLEEKRRANRREFGAVKGLEVGMKSIPDDELVEIYDKGWNRGVVDSFGGVGDAHATSKTTPEGTR